MPPDRKALFAANNFSWGRAFFGNLFSMKNFVHPAEYKQGSCFAEFVDSAKPLLKVASDVQKYSKTYAAQIVASLPASGASLQALFYSTVQYGASNVNAGMMGDAAATAVDFVSTNASTALAKVPTVALAAGDVALLNGVVNEARVGLNGGCTP